MAKKKKVAKKRSLPKPKHNTPAKKPPFPPKFSTYGVRIVGVNNTIYDYNPPWRNLGEEEEGSR